MSNDAQDSQQVPSVYQRLAVPFAVEDHAKVNKGSGSQTYAPWTSYVQRLNDELGENWSFRAIREGFTETECWVLGEITAIVDGAVAVRQQYGCEPIAVGQKPNGDLLKKAATDAIKKAASLLGVGLYLSDKEEREAIEAEMHAAVQAEAKRQADERANKSKPQPAPPTPLSKARAAAELTGAAPAQSQERTQLLAKLGEGVNYARSIGLDPAALDVTKLANQDIEEVIEALRSQCRHLLAARKKEGAA